MTRDELLHARVQWLTSAVRGLLKLRYGVLNGASSKHPYEESAAGQRDAELRKEEEKADLDLGPVALRYFRKKAQQAIEDFIRERL